MEPLNDWFTRNPEKVLQSVYSDNAGWIEQYVLQNSGTASDAQDLFQDTITAAWINLNSGQFYGTREQFNAYLRQIARHKWLNTLRARSRKKVYSTDQVPDQEAFSAFSENENETTISILKSCYSQLGEKCRNVLQLFYYRKKSLNEIAQSLNNTENSIKTIKYRCMMQLRQLFLEKSRSNEGI